MELLFFYAYPLIIPFHVYVVAAVMISARAFENKELEF